MGNATHNAKSLALQERARQLLIGSGQGHRRYPELWEMGYPIFATHGEGPYFWDADGHRYIDYLLSYGPIILGHAHPGVQAAVLDQMRKGIIFNLEHPLVLDLAEALCEVIPCAEMAGFFVGGSGATAGAVRLARVHTRRDLVVYCGYHGWQDWSQLDRLGVPRLQRALSLTFPYNDLDALHAVLRAHPDEVACVIMEPTRERLPHEGFVEGVLDLAHEHGALFILDEVKTGFRFGLGGYQAFTGIMPDLAILGKGMANGYPGSAVVGRREVLEGKEDVYLGATFHGDLCSVAAALATLQELKKTDGPAHIWAMGKRLSEGLWEVFAAAGSPLGITGYPPMLSLTYPDEAKPLAQRFLVEAAVRGAYLSLHPWFISTAHTAEDIDATIRIAADALEAAERAVGTKVETEA